MEKPTKNIGTETRVQFLSFSQIRRWPEFGVIIAFMVLFTIFSIFSSKFLTLRNITGDYYINCILLFCCKRR
ncbi:unnamed protein product [marine sediment metagenome]|uniref:CDR ABC transporter domain-containing protein n=1 Tax=marine sediment metagenome TaxID=412755 RepID=X1F4V1_9ZZZZ